LSSSYTHTFVQVEILKSVANFDAKVLVVDVSHHDRSEAKLLIFDVLSRERVHALEALVVRSSRLERHVRSIVIITILERSLLTGHGVKLSRGKRVAQGTLAEISI